MNDLPPSKKSLIYTDPEIRKAAAEGRRKRAASLKDLGFKPRKDGGALQDIPYCNFMANED